MNFTLMYETEMSSEQKLSKTLMFFCRGMKNKAVNLLLSLDNNEFYYLYEALNIDNLFSDKPEQLDDINIVELLVRSTEEFQEHTDDKIRFIFNEFIYSL